MYPTLSICVDGLRKTTKASDSTTDLQNKFEPATFSRYICPCGNFSLHHRVQTDSGAHHASYPMGTSGSFPGDRLAGA